jgi:hypothetical protein
VIKIENLSAQYSTLFRSMSAGTILHVYAIISRNPTLNEPPQLYTSTLHQNKWHMLTVLQVTLTQEKRRSVKLTIDTLEQGTLELLG